MYFNCMINDDIGIKFDISTLKIDKGDTIILTFDINDINCDVNNIQKIMKVFSEQFYDNKVIARFKNFDIEVEKCQ